MKKAIEHPDGSLGIIEYPDDSRAPLFAVPPGGRAHNVPDGVDVSRIDEYHISEGRFTRRPRLPFRINKTTVKANGADTVVISNIPEGAHIKIFSHAPGDWQRFVVADGTDLELTISEKYPIKVTIRANGYRAAEVDIDAR